MGQFQKGRELKPLGVFWKCLGGVMAAFGFGAWEASGMGELKALGGEGKKGAWGKTVQGA